MEKENIEDRDHQGELAIPLDANVLGEFIASLLGQPRTIERRFSDRRFEIDTSWLLNLDLIIDQRLAAQNQGKLVSFAARIYFANGKMVILSDRDAFRSFHDMSNELSVGVDLRWSYLIKFPLAKLPEKQEIRFSAFTDKEITEKRQTEKKRDRSFITSTGEDELLSISIHFTDVTWGEDLYSHIGNYIVAKTEAVAKWKLTLRKVRAAFVAPIAALTGLILMTYTFMSGVTSVMGKVSDKFGNFQSLSFSELNQKIDFLVALAIARSTVDFLPLAPIGRALLLYVGLIAAYTLLIIRRASFININDYSSKYLMRYGKNYDFIQYGIVAGLVIGIVGGLFSNRLYDLSKAWW